ncbi:MAG: discoidin domain-containing protein [Candidatus Omnitrophica bacterium]|nr:discoidin domain-containing protein [Candidatus Omnitrophota bacterium]
MRMLTLLAVLVGLAWFSEPSDGAEPASAAGLAKAQTGGQKGPAKPGVKLQTMQINPGQSNTVAFAPIECRYVRFLVLQSAGEPCIDELEVYGPDGKVNLALAKNGAKATASSCLQGYEIHQIAHLNDGFYGNDHSWIPSSAQNEWAQIELPELTQVAKVVFSRDRLGNFQDRIPALFEVRVSVDSKKWTTVARVESPVQMNIAAQSGLPDVKLPDPFTWAGLVRYAFLCEKETWAKMDSADHLSPLRVNRPALPGGAPYWGDLVRLDPVSRVLRQMADLADRLAEKGLDVTAGRRQLAEFRQRQLALAGLDEEARAAAEDQLYLDARMAKRELFFREPELAPLERILFVKRHPYTPSHNYSDYLDSQFRGGGGICVLEIPRINGRLDPDLGKVTVLFDAGDGIARDPVATFDSSEIYFAYRPVGKPGTAYWHIMAIRPDGTGLRQLTDGPFHDYYPCPLPDGDLGFITTRCKSRYLCWVPMSCVLFRMQPDGSHITPVSYSNLSEWGPSIMSDGRIVWTRSEYLDKGADFGHTIWATRPDGTQTTLLYGNDTRNCYMNAHEVPGTSELCCTLIAHGGDFNGPIAMIDISQGPFNDAAITSITPDVRPHYHMDWARAVCFRDPIPLSRDYVLASHAPADRFGLYVIDRYGNREVLYLDPDIGAMTPTPLRAVPTPPVIAYNYPQAIKDQWGQLIVANVYQGLGDAVKAGSVKYLRVVQEVRSDLETLPNGKLKEDYPPFEDYYAAPTHKIQGPYGWPSFVAKGDYGLVPVEADGSANFYAPVGKALYFEALDGDFNEIQRMRSLTQLQPGEVRSCIGCHEHRVLAPTPNRPLAMQREPSHPQPPEWGAGPFSYAKVVQPVWDRNCVQCHNAEDKKGFNLTGTLDADRVPASYRALITKGWVHYFSYQWGEEHNLAAPLTFGTVKSKLWPLLDAGHHDVKLTEEEKRRIKCWTDLDCPLWPDYRYRLNRPSLAATTPPTE